MCHSARMRTRRQDFLSSANGSHATTEMLWQLSCCSSCVASWRSSSAITNGVIFVWQSLSFAGTMRLMQMTPAGLRGLRRSAAAAGSASPAAAAAAAQRAASVTDRQTVWSARPANYPAPDTATAARRFFLTSASTNCRTDITTWLCQVV